ncbi:MAG: hypothetical protein HYX80_02080 [Chloroflexi bacterium]|nr:hypothetical protein [Chloroflexota bacterium]
MVNAGETLFRVDFGENLALLLNAPMQAPGDYPTDRLQKGWLLAHNGELLAEEGIGFGMPIVKYGRKTVFPGEAEVTARTSASNTEVTVRYVLDTTQRLGIKGQPELKILAINRAREFFSALHRRFPRLRRSLDILSFVFQNTFRLEPAFERAKSVGSISITYLFRRLEKSITVVIELENLEKKGCTEIIIANEQGAGFDRYRDSNGTALRGEAIGSWDEVTAGQASLSSVRPAITFSVDGVAGARLFRGREQRKGRLAWSGLNYVISPSTRHFEYEIRLAEGGG